MRSLTRKPVALPTPPQLPQSLAELQSLEVELEDRLAEVRLQQIYLLETPDSNESCSQLEEGVL